MALHAWFFFIGCLLGELSGQLFPMNQQEAPGVGTSKSERSNFQEKARNITQFSVLCVHQPVTLWQPLERVGERVAEMIAKSALQAVLALDTRP